MTVEAIRRPLVAPAAPRSAPQTQHLLCARIRIAAYFSGRRKFNVRNHEPDPTRTFNADSGESGRRITGSGAVFAAGRAASDRALHLPGIHLALPRHWPAGFRAYRYRLRPGALLVESKSLKLFLTSFRNHGAFHEDCTVMIGRRIVASTSPLWLRIAGYWYPRGGIPIDVFWQTGTPPEGIWLPDTGVQPYRGRG